MSLDRAAKTALRDAGLTPKRWTATFFPGATRWPGDVCGCPDDRCIGHHHDADEACGCLAALIRATEVAP